MNDLQQYLRSLRKQGYQLQLTGGDHHMIRCPVGCKITTASCTSRSSSGLRNLQAAIRRHQRQHEQEHENASESTGRPRGPRDARRGSGVA